VNDPIGVMLLFVVIIVFVAVISRPHPYEWSRAKRLKVIEKLKRRRDKINEKLSGVYGGGTRCTNCLRWPWETEEPHSWVDTGLRMQMTCGTCGHVSHWIDGPGVMLEVKSPLAPVYIG
jgi:hypothetical protein